LTSQPVLRDDTNALSTTDAKPTPNLVGFWTWFADHQAEIFEIIQGKKPGRVTEMIDHALREMNLQDLTYEVTGGPGGAELTFTPQGDPVMARFLDRFVNEAPSLENWMIFSRIQRKSLSSALKFVKALHGIDISDARLKSVELEGRYHLCFLHDGLLALDDEKRFSVASTFLDHALGERTVMEWIGQLEFKKSGEGISMGFLVNEILVETTDELVTSLRPAG
jgi:hypothetical protein